MPSSSSASSSKEIRPDRASLPTLRHLATSKRVARAVDTQRRHAKEGPPHLGTKTVATIISSFITPRELDALLHSDQSPLLICFCSEAGNHRVQSWIENSVDVEFNEIETWAYDSNGQALPGSGNLKPDEELKSVLEKIGVTHDRRVVVYSKPTNEDSVWGGEIAAARLVWALLYAGVKEAQVLNGGLREWQEQGFAVVGRAKKRQPTTFNAKFGAGAQFLATAAEVEAAVAARGGNAVLGDVRSWDEFTGQRHDYNYMRLLPGGGNGRIPTAKWAQWGPSTYVGGCFWDKGSTSCVISAKKLVEIEDMWRAEGIVREKPAIFYCGSGWRSSLAFLIARELGWTNVKNYDGGWLEWALGGRQTMRGDASRRSLRVFQQRQPGGPI